MPSHDPFQPEDLTLRTPAENVDAGISPLRLRRFERGLLTPSEMTLLLQDVLEANVLDRIPDKWTAYVAYYTYIGLCTIPGKKGTS